MGIGIVVCGLNGSGKSTLGKALADALGFHFIDSENLFFPKSDSVNTYTFSRSYKEVKAILLNEVREYDNFVLATVKGNYGEDILPFYQYIVIIDAPKEIRLHRVKNRSFQRFGKRVLPGGDLYEQEKSFLEMVSSRTEHEVEGWVQSLNCPIIRVDGTKNINENLSFVIGQIQP